MSASAGIQTSIMFGSGDLFLTPISGLLAPNPTPTKVGTLQDITIDISATTKPLYGKKQFAVTMRRGQGKIQCKAKFANIQGKQLNDAFFGSTITAAQTLYATDELGTPASHVIVAAHAVSGVILADLGVVDIGTGQSMTLVASAPALGQYSVVLATGTYSFNASDTNAKLLSYTYGSTAGSSFTVANNPVGACPVFSVKFGESDSGSLSTTPIMNLIGFGACVANKLSLGSKLEDYVIPEFDWDVFQDVNGNIFSYDSTY